MKLSYLILSCMLQLASSRSLNFWSDSTITAADYPVPGDNPMSFCTQADLAEDILQLGQVDLSPNPPEKGKTLVVKANGFLTQDVEQGAYVKLTVKFGLITILRTQADLCEQLEKVDEPCTVKKGPHVIMKEIEIPKEIPPGKYSVNAAAFTKDDEKITCLDAVVHFDRS